MFFGWIASLLDVTLSFLMKISSFFCNDSDPLLLKCTRDSGSEESPANRVVTTKENVVNEKKIMLGELQALASLPKDALIIVSAVAIVLHSAFEESKPLFSIADKPKAAKLIVKCLPKFRAYFADLDSCIFPNLVQTAQRARSGLQFLIDEFVEDQVYHKLKHILTSAPVQCVEKSIKYGKSVPPEWPRSILPADLTAIPESHFWWSDSTDDSEDSGLVCK